MRLTSVSIALMSGLLASLPAWSAISTATVSTVTGIVLINRGDGFKQVEGKVEAHVGNTVTAKPDSLGQIDYPDGCSRLVKPGSVIAVAAQSPCKAGIPPPEVAAGAGAAETSALTYVLVGGAIAAVAGGAVALGAGGGSDGNNDGPASP